MLAGQNGSTYLEEWKTKRQATTATSSGDAEGIEWCAAMHTGKRIAEMLKFSQIRHSEIIARTDNDSLWLAVERGSSRKLVHLRKTAEVNFNFLKMTQTPLRRVDTTRKRSPPRSSGVSSHHGTCWVNHDNNAQAVLNVEFHRECETCEICNPVDTGDFLSVVRSRRVSQTLAFSVLLSCMRVFEARAEISSAFLPAEINTLWLLAPFAFSQRRRMGAREEAPNEKLKVKTTKGSGTTLEQSVWTILEDDEPHRVQECEARRGKEYMKLSVCNVKSSASSKPKPCARVFYTTIAIKFHSSENCYGLRNARMSLEALKCTKSIQSEEPGPKRRV